MSMYESSIGWVTVANTVASRLVDTSLIHELVPSRKLQRNTKALNAVLTEKSTEVPYSGYIEIKTALSQDLPDDDETDDNVSSTEEDYKPFCKEHFTVITSRGYNAIQTPPRNAQMQHQYSDVRNNESTIKIKSHKYREMTRVNKNKNGTTHSVNVGWQKIIKKGNKIVCSPAFNYDRDVPNRDTSSFNKKIAYTGSIHDDTSLIPLSVSSEQASTLEQCASLCNEASLNRQCGAFTNTVSTDTKANQPKDSGIDEDFEEDPWNNATFDHKGTDQSFHKVSCNVQPSSDTKLEENLRGVTILDEPIDGNIINVEGQEHKLQPRVTCAEIVNTRYKIVSTDTPLLSDCDRRKGLKNIRQPRDDKTSECPEEEVNSVDCVSPAIARRLRQLRRLNLTIDDDSSFSDDDSDCVGHTGEEEAPNVRFIERPRDTFSIMDGRIVHEKWKEKRKREVNETPMEEFSMESAEQFVVSRRKTNLDFNSSTESTNKVARHYRNYEDTFYSDNDDSAEEQSTSPLIENTLDRSSCREKEIENNKVNARDRHDLSIEANKGSTYDCDTDDFDVRIVSTQDKQKRLVAGPANVTSEMEISNVLSMTQRPCNLRELMETEGLIEETSTAAISLKNLLEDDIFILEIPKTVLQRQLLGKKFILTEGKLKIGKQKYKAIFKHAETVSCVFSTGESRKPYETVNIKPSARVLAFKKMIDNSEREISS